GVSEFELDAFKNCSSIVNVYITDLEAWLKIKLNSINSSPLKYDATVNMYLNGELLTDVIIPDGVEYIGLAFFNCVNIETVYIPDSVKQIAVWAFYGCSSLNSVTFENTEDWSVRIGSNSDSIPLDVTDSSKNAINISQDLPSETMGFASYEWNCGLVDEEQ
ncbi:MAG: leucine-rich repeat protein, partial [Clostridia bacterium]|nr:leucine-rich repeat protein [Clostridia bacterium]